MQRPPDRARRTGGLPARGRHRAPDEESAEGVLAGHGLLVPGDADPADIAAGPDDSTPPDPGRRRRSLAVRLLAVGVTVLVFLATAWGWGAKTWLDSRIRPVSALDLQAGAITKPAEQTGDENVLLLGLDSGAGATGSDTVTLTHVPGSGGAVVTIAFPRDLEINRPPCQRWDGATATYRDETVPAETRTKLGSAYPVGGPQCAVRVIQQLTGMAVTRFVALNLDRLGTLVDDVGGVGVCVERPVVDGLLGPVVPVAGPTTLDGARTLDFVRARSVRGDPPADQGLIQRQQQVFDAFLEKALSRTVLLDPAAVRAVGSVLGGAVRTDGADLDELVALARALRNLDAGDVRFLPVPVAGEPNTRGNVVLRDGDTADLFQALRAGVAPPEPSAVPQAGAASPAPPSITLDVLNSSDRKGLANQVAAALRELGFGVGEVGNTERPDPATVIRFSPDRADAVQAVQAVVPSARPVPDGTGSQVLQLVLGNSFDGTVRAPAAPGGATRTPDPATPAARCP